MTKKRKIDSFGRISVKKIVILKIIDDFGKQKEIWVGDLDSKISKLTIDTKAEYGLNYKENSIYKILDKMAEQNLIQKYKVIEPHLYCYVKITDFGLSILRNLRKLLEKKNNKKQ